MLFVCEQDDQDDLGYYRVGIPRAAKLVYPIGYTNFAVLGIPTLFHLGYTTLGVHGIP